MVVAGTDSVIATAPTRICDCGGWTDTWFASHGCVCNIAIEPRVRVRVTRKVDGELHKATATHDLFFQEVAFQLCGDEAASLVFDIDSSMPLGSSTGTSASICVALVAAIVTVTGKRMSLQQLAEAAHRAEVEVGKRQSGVQDHAAAAFGGISFITLSQYPQFAVEPVQVSGATRTELGKRLKLIYLGASHDSSTVHDAVIRSLRSNAANHTVLAELRRAAVIAKNALSSGDLTAYGSTMSANTSLQSELHPDLLSDKHHLIIDIARHYRAIGWKVNGAGGPGGSVSLLSSADAFQAKSMVDAIMRADPEFRDIPLTLSPCGVRVRSSERIAEHSEQH